MHYTRLRFYDSVQDANLGYRCLASKCPNSCCYGFQSVEITVKEMVHLSKYFPIHFPFNQGLNRFVIHAVLRLPEDKKGCFYLKDGEGCSLGENKPLFCKSYPLFVHPETKNLIIDPDCPGISPEENRKIIVKGTINPEIEAECIVPAVEYAEALKQTYAFTDFLQKHNLIAGGYFEAKGVRIPTNSIQETNLLRLPVNVLYEAISQGYMAYIYAHINSLGNFLNLIERATKEKVKEQADIFIL